MRIIKQNTFLMCLALLISVYGGLAGCGETLSTAPDGSTIEINATEVSFNVFAAGCPSTVTNDLPMTIIVRDKNGAVLNNILIYINLTFTAYTSDPTQWYWYLLDYDKGGVPVPVPYKTSTGDYGTKNVAVRIDRGCAATGYIEVFSGTAYKMVDISVT